jgi:hypothetical protein
MQSYVRWIIGVVAVTLGLAVVGTGVSRHYAAGLATARTETATAQDALRASLVTASRDSAAAAEFADSARIERAAAAVEHARADTAHRLAATALGAYRTLRATVPDTCQAVTRAADSVISLDSAASDHQSAEISDLHRSLINEQNRGDSLSHALTLVTGSAGTLDGKVAVLIGASKPSVISRLLPHLGAGLALGVDATGQPHAIIGVTLGWSF